MPNLDFHDPFALSLVLATALVAGFVRGYTGFGGPAVMLLVLVPFFNPLSAIAKVTIIDFVSNVKLLPSTAGEVDRRVAVTLILAGLAGAPLGLYALYTFEPEIMQRAVAATVALCTVVMMLGWRIRRAPSLAAHAIAGFVSGAVLGATMIALLTIVWLFATPAKVSTSRATMIFWGFATTLFLITVFVLTGAITALECATAALVGVLYLFSTQLGMAAYRRSSERNFRAAVLWLMLFLALVGLVA